MLQQRKQVPDEAPKMLQGPRQKDGKQGRADEEKKKKKKGVDDEVGWRRVDEVGEWIRIFRTTVSVYKVGEGIDKDLGCVRAQFWLSWLQGMVWQRYRTSGALRKVCRRPAGGEFLSPIIYPRYRTASVQRGGEKGTVL